MVTQMRADADATRVTCDKRAVRRWYHEGDELTRFLGWRDQHGNVHVARMDEYGGKHREGWMVQPPKGQMEFNGPPNVPTHKFEFTTARNRYPGSDRDEDRLVMPEHLDSEVAPPDFEELWNKATKIKDCPENTYLFRHYLKG